MSAQPYLRSISPGDANRLIRHLVKFLGGEFVVEKELEIYAKSWQQSKPFLRTYLEQAHPWWRQLLIVRNLQKNGERIADHIAEIRPLLADAAMISDLYKTMPEHVRKRYASDLLTEQAKDYLKEIEVAWRYFQYDFQIEWAGDTPTKKPEFKVMKNKISFAVEIKNISVDNSRKIKRKDFRRLTDEIFPSLRDKRLHGEVAFTVKTVLPKKNEWMSFISSALVENLRKTHKGSFEHDDCLVEYDLSVDNSDSVNILEVGQNYRSRHLSEHVAFVCQDDGRNSIFIRCRSEAAEKVTEGIYNRLKEGRNQIRAQLGLIIGFIPEIDDFQLLQSEGGLKAIAGRLLSSDDSKTIGGLLYVSDVHERISESSTGTFRETLYFKNIYCAVPPGFPFINETK